MSEERKPWQNKSGCNDPTDFEALKPTEDEIRVSKLVKVLRAVAELSGFEIINRIEFRDRKSGRTFR